MHYFSLLLLLFSLSLAPLQGSFQQGSFKDLEQNPNECIIDLKQVVIPGHEHAFNPSLVRWKDHYLLCFREVSGTIIHSPQSAASSTISLVWLDDDFNPISTAYKLDFNNLRDCTDDARILVVGDELQIIYSDNIEEVITDSGFRMWTAKIEVNEDSFRVYDQEKLTYFDGEQEFRREKNWTPFDYQSFLCLSYSLSPHKVFLPVKGTECCYTLSEHNQSLEWKWGEIRGGTPAILVNGHYLTFFHSCMDMQSLHSQGKSSLHYFMGAALFASSPPFEILKISKKPLVAKGFYSGENYIPYWKPVNAIFPCGIWEEKKTLIVSYGRQDHELWIARFDTKSLIESLTEE